MSNLSFELSQKQTISQKNIQNIEILQMSAYELELYLNNIATENPVIDQDFEKSSSTINISSPENYKSNSTKSEHSSFENDNSFEQFYSKPENNLTEHIIFQLIPFFNDEKVKSIFHFMVESLDEHGFLTINANDLCSIFKISNDTACEYISKLQSVEPAGIGATNLCECLILQLQRLDNPLSNLSISVLNCSIDKIAYNQTKELASILNVDVSDVADALELIKTLNPRPANGFYCGELATYIQPDVIIVQRNRNFQITINSELTPKFKINNNYRQMLNHPDKEVRDYLYQKFQQADWINKCLEQRNTTLIRIAQQLVIEQKAFFLKGPNYLKPLSQSQVSSKLDLNDSTISRAISDKYLECFWGVLPLKYLFSKAAPSGDSNLTVDQLKTLIKSLIEKEDKKRPLSDQKLVNELEKHDISVARRTIAKYRSEMLIPDTSKRRIH